MQLFSNLFSLTHPSIFTRHETFCENKGLFRVFGTMRLTGALLSKKFFANFFYFLKGFRLRNMSFLLFPVGKIVLETYAYPFGYFWRCKIDEILSILSFFTLVRSIWLFGSFLKSSQLSSQGLRSTASPLCYIIDI